MIITATASTCGLRYAQNNDLRLVTNASSKDSMACLSAIFVNDNKTKMVKNEKIINLLMKTKTKTKNDEN